MSSTRPASLFLIGMMGAGKTTVGKLLARKLGFGFVDADRELEARSGVSISTVFELEGEDGFRRREELLIDELTLRSRIVLATGGGAVLREANRRHLHERGVVIYLRATADEIERRTLRDKSRPLLQTGDRRERIEQLLAERTPLYEQTAHVVVQSSPANPARLVDRLLADERLMALAEALPPASSAT
jgi:shikimate kinase